jgi:hypothetical protein
MKSLILALISCAFIGQALADDANKHSCQRPVTPNMQSSDTVIKLFNKRMVKYGACIDKFVTERRAYSKEMEKADPTKASEAWEAAEAAQKEYNSLVEEVNANSAPQDDTNK